MIYFLFDGPDDAPLTIALAHGAGSPMDSPFMAAFARGLAGHGLRVARFEFPYMVRRRDDGRRRPPDRAPVLVDTWLAVIAELGPENLVIGGKSLGGRIASMVADKAGVAGLVCLGYPFHAPGREADSIRLAHLESLITPTLIVQGTRDTLGNASDVAGYALGPAIGVHWLEDGDHGFKPRKSSGLSEEQSRGEAIQAVAAFASRLGR